jgi:7-keto-8-aminopelargonate synthetase-like enzyme
MPERRRSSDEVKWIDRWLAACADLDELKRSNPMTDAVIEEINGRRIRVGDQWLADFASCNYLGFDLDREIMDSIPAQVARWGTHPSWSTAAPTRRSTTAASSPSPAAPRSSASGSRIPTIWSGC